MNDPQSDSDAQSLLARWLVEHANEALAAAGEAIRDPLKLSTKLRKCFEVEQTRALCSLAETRSKAEAKFANAARMFFTSVGYEQSTSQAIANYKAQRFAELRLEVNATGDSVTKRRFVDLCCGIGGDAIWLAEYGALTVVDRSATCVEFALANLRLHAREGQGVVDDLRRVELANFDAWHIDPDRRVDGSRRSSPDLCEPPLEEFLNLPGLPQHGAIKLAPAADASHLLSLGAELEWIGCQQDCRQQVAWFGDLARYPGRRTATWIAGAQYEESHIVEQLVEERENGACESADELRDFLYEPRASVIAADLTNELARQFALSCLRGVAYLTSNTLHESLLFRRFRILETGAFREQKLQKRLAETGVRVTEVKKRGVDVDPENLLRQLKSTQDSSSLDAQAAVLILFPLEASIRYAIAVRDDLA